jgi:hypothetical protein
LSKSQRPKSPKDDIRGRLRLDACEMELTRGGLRRVRVRLRSPAQADHEGRAAGFDTLQGTLRAGAEACLAAAEQAVDKRMELALIGVKAVRAFDALVVIAAVEAKLEDQHYRLLGAHIGSDEEAVRGAVLAVLGALNRILEPLIRDE